MWDRVPGGRITDTAYLRSTIAPWCPLLNAAKKRSRSLDGMSRSIMIGT